MIFTRCSPATVLALGLLTFLWTLGPDSALSEPDADLREDETITPDGIHVLDGSYVMNMGELHINITNHGLIGSQFTSNLPYSTAPSGEWPGGSGNEYLWGAGLWIGGRVNGQAAVSTGQPERELRPGPGLFDTIYEARNGKVIRPWPSDVATGNRLPLGTMAWQPSYDGELLVESPRPAERREIPILIGTTREEWKMFTAMDRKRRRLDDASLRQYMARTRFASSTLGEQGADEARGLYERCDETGERRRASEIWVAFQTDRVFRQPAIALGAVRVLRRHVVRARVPRVGWLVI